jgi:hypothetical protein
MAMVRVAPVSVAVRTDWFSGTPREITWGSDRLPITRVVAVRDERSAYPAITGPRTLFEVDTPAYRLALTYRHRSRRWTIEGLDEDNRAA